MSFLKQNLSRRAGSITLIILLSIVIFQTSSLGYRLSNASNTPVRLPGYQNSPPGVIPASPIIEYPIPSPNGGPNAIIAGQNHTLWFTEFNASKIGEFFLGNQTFREYQVPESGARPDSLALDGNGRIWFTDQNPTQGGIWMFDPSNQSFIQHVIPTRSSTPVFVLVDPHNNVWFTESTANKLGLLSAPSYATSEYPLPTPNSGPVELALQPGSQYLWITENFANQIARFDTSSHTFQEYAATLSLKSPLGIVVDNAGNVWFSEHGGSAIVKLIPSNNTYIKYPTSLPVGTDVAAISAPATLTIDSVGRLWFVEHYSNRVGRLYPTNGSIEEFVIPTQGAYSVLNTLDAEGNFWFTEYYSNKIGTVPSDSTSGILVQYVGSGNEVSAGQSLTRSLRIQNQLDSSVEVSLTVSSSFSQTGQTTTSQVSLSSTSLTLTPNDNASISVTITPDASLQPGLYSVAVAVNSGGVSTVAIILLQVGGPSFLSLLGLYWVEILSLLVVVSGIGIFLVWRRRPRTQSGVRKSPITGTGAKILVLVMLIIALAAVQVPILPVFAKCPGIPIGGGGSPGSPDLIDTITYLMIFVGAAAVAVIVYFSFRKNLQQKKDIQKPGA